MSKPVLVVMAAGIGSRYGGLKQIAPVGPHGELIIDYSVHDALKAGFGKVIFVITKSLLGSFRENIGKTIEQQIETDYVFQEMAAVPEGFHLPPDRKKPWGTAHAILQCNNVVNAPFAVINADDFYGQSAFQTLHDYLHQIDRQDQIIDYCLVGYVLENTLTEYGHVARGVCSVNEEDFLVDIREHTRIQQFGDIVKYTEDNKTWIEIANNSIVSMNLWGFTPTVFQELETRFLAFLQRNTGNIEKNEYFIPNVVGELVNESVARVKVLPTNESWFGVTYRQDVQRSREAIIDLVNQGIYQDNLWCVE
jgi:UTP-glucose-1-phosphate uridylyltransferase